MFMMSFPTVTGKGLLEEYSISFGIEYFVDVFTKNIQMLLKAHPMRDAQSQLILIGKILALESSRKFFMQRPLI